MGEAKAKKDEFAASVRVAVDRVSRALVIQALKRASGKGSLFSKSLAQALRTFMRDDDWTYLEDGGDPSRPPGTDSYTIQRIPGKLHALLVELGVPLPADGKVSFVVRIAGSENDVRVLDIAKGTIDFVLKTVWEDSTLSGNDVLRLAKLQEDLESAKAGTYELLESVESDANNGQDAPAETPYARS